MNIEYCNPGELVDRYVLPRPYAGCCGALQKKGGGWKPEFILIDKNLTTKYARITIIHEAVHWFLYKMGFSNHWIWEWFWYRCVRFFYSDNMYKKEKE